MSLAARNDEIERDDFNEDSASNALESELKKGLKSYEDGKVLTIEEAWTEIDLI